MDPVLGYAFAGKVAQGRQCGKWGGTRRRGYQVGEEGMSGDLSELMSILA
jgi:hypothetical protein